MKTIVIATSPLQIENAARCISQLEIRFSDCYLMHILSGSEESNLQAKKSANKFPWRSINSFPPYRPFNKANLFYCTKDNATNLIIWKNLEHLNRQLYIDIIKNAFETINDTFNTVIIGDYRPASFRQFLRFVKTSSVEIEPEVILIDDGSVSRYVMKYREGGKTPEEIKRNLLPSLGDSDPFRMVEPSSLTYFTIYQEEIAQHDKLIPNNFYEGISQKVKFKKTNEIWICGANHVEAGIAKQSEYFDLCKTIRNWFPKQEINYLPHRKEQPEKLALIKKITDFNIINKDCGIEEFIVETRIEPRLIVAFGSTVVDTLSRIFSPITKLIVAVPRNSYFTSSSRRNHVLAVIEDNIRKNNGVIGLPAELPDSTKWFTLHGKVLNDLQHDDLPEHRLKSPDQTKPQSIENLSQTSANSTELTYREGGAHGMHRLILHEHTDHSAKLQSSLLYIFRIKSEGRSTLKFRLTSLTQTDIRLDTTIDIDSPGVTFEANEFGNIITEISVDENRVSTITMVITSTLEDFSLQAITLRSRSAISSFHDSNERVGFSLLPMPVRTTRSLKLNPSNPNSSLHIYVPTGKKTPISILSIFVDEDWFPILLYDAQLEGKVESKVICTQLGDTKCFPTLKVERLKHSTNLDLTSSISINFIARSLIVSSGESSCSIPIEKENCNIRVGTNDYLSGKLLIKGFLEAESGQTLQTGLLM
ncbi:MAG: hypothetical protein ACFHHU_10350 [Porticoccaceae bacterium]